MNQQIKSQKKPSVRVAVYIRVSTEDQVVGHSLDTQKDDCLAFAAFKGWTISEIYSDPGHSGGSLNRPGLHTLLKDASLGLFDVVLVWKMDRFSRKTRDLINLVEDLHQINIAFASAKENIDTTCPTNTILLYVLGIIAEIERENIIARVKPNMKRGVEAGERQGGIAPYGYKNCPSLKDAAGKKIQASKLEIVPEEAAIVKEIFRLYLEGFGCRRLAQFLNSQGFRHREGGKWINTSIHKILKSEVYLGHIVWNKRPKKNIRSSEPEQQVRSENTHPAIIDERTFRSVQSVLVARNVGAITRNLSSPYVLSGIVRCGKCGGSGTGTLRRINHRTKVKRRKYHCSGANTATKRCSQNSIDAEKVETLAVGWIKEIALRSNICEQITVHLQAMQPVDEAKSQEIAELRNALNAKRQDQENLLGILMRDPDDAVVGERYNIVKNEAKVLDNNLRNTERRTYSATHRAQSVIEVMDLLQDFDSVWESLSHEDRKQAIGTVIEEMTMDAGMITSVGVAPEFQGLLEVQTPITCELHPRKIDQLNEELHKLRGSRTIREFAKELGLSETHFGQVERGLAPLTPAFRAKIDAWKSRQSTPTTEFQ